MLSALLAKHRKVFRPVNPVLPVHSSTITKKEKLLSIPAKKTVIKTTEKISAKPAKNDKSWEPIVAISYPELEETFEISSHSSSFYNMLEEYKEQQRRYPKKLEV